MVITRGGSGDRLYQKYQASKPYMSVDHWFCWKSKAAHTPADYLQSFSVFGPFSVRRCFDVRFWISSRLFSSDSVWSFFPPRGWANNRWEVWGKFVLQSLIHSAVAWFGRYCSGKLSGSKFKKLWNSFLNDSGVHPIFWKLYTLRPA